MALLSLLSERSTPLANCSSWTFQWRASACFSTSPTPSLVGSSESDQNEQDEDFDDMLSLVSSSVSDQSGDYELPAIREAVVIDENKTRFQYTGAAQY